MNSLYNSNQQLTMCIGHINILKFHRNQYILVLLHSLEGKDIKLSLYHTVKVKNILIYNRHNKGILSVYPLNCSYTVCYIFF